MAGDLDARGVEQLHSTLDAAQRALPAALDAASDEAGTLLADAAQRRAPRLTGTLARSHEHTVRAGVLTVTNTARYAPYVHARNPWLSNTLDAARTRVLDLYDRQLQQLVDTIEGA